ncbi:MAG: serine/threonine-protein kinase [Phycisphaerae bacterium]
MANNYKPGLRVSEYLLEERVGIGSFGEVWSARHHIWDRERVAVKLPTQPEYVTYLQREGVMVHGLRHENIIRVLGLDPYADVPYLVMELVRGPSLKQVIADHPTGVAIDAALTLLRGILQALNVAHAAKVLHRDLKPGNVMLDLDGRPLDQLRVGDVKVGDFGFGLAAGAARGVAQSASLDRADRLVGTLAYMAPELRDGVAQTDARADLYAVGVVLFELLTGARPAGAELPGTLRADVPRWLDDVFAKLYARYERRYAAAADALADLDRNARPPRGLDGPPPIPPPLPREAANRRICPACQMEVESDDQFCTRCGRQLFEDIRKCPKCGAYPAPSDRFCIFCGVRLPEPAGR